MRLPDRHPYEGMDMARLIEARGSRLRDRPFLHWEPFEGSGRTWTYGEFARDAWRVAAGLRRLGVEPGSGVVLHLGNRPQAQLAWAACARLGAVAVRVNYRLTAAELTGLASRLGDVVVLTEPELADRSLTAFRHARGVLALAPDGTFPPDLDGDPDDIPWREPDPGLPLSVQFTSGTTGVPKGVVWTHANELWAAQVGAAHGRLGADDAHLVHMPLFHTVAHSWQFLSALWAGAKVVLQPRFSARRFWPVSRRHQCTWTWTVPFHVRALLARDRPAARVPFRYVGGAYCAPSSDDRLGFTTIGALGMTELVTQIVMGDLAGPNRRGVLGRGVPEYGLLVSTADGRPAGPGETGELLVRGVRGLSVFAEYFDDPAATAAAFRPDGAFRTGDTVRVMDDGTLRFADRAADILKVGGENVGAREVEDTIRGVAGVAGTVVVAAPDPMLDEIPVAFVVAASGASDALAHDVLAHCHASLADFKVPRRIHVVRASDLPLNELGKVSRAELRRRLRAAGGALVPAVTADDTNGPR